MNVHTRTRGKLELRMQRFLAGTDGRKFASKIYRVEGSSSLARMNQYGQILKGALAGRFTQHPKTYGIDSTLLSLADRDKVRKFFKTPVQAKMLEAYYNNRIYIVESEEQLAQLQEIQTLLNE